MSIISVDESAPIRPSRARRAGAACALAAVSLGLVASAATAGAATADAATAHAATASTTSTNSGFAFETLNDGADPTFNQLLGINNHNVIVGYFGSGSPAAVHPNKGYQLNAPYSATDYHNENFPGSQQTQVVGINKSGTTVGFWVKASGRNLGFVKYDGRFISVSNPHSDASPRVDQLLGVNDYGVAAGFYNDAHGNSHGYTYTIGTRHFHAVRVPGATSVVATGINNDGWITGFAVVKGVTVGFIQSDSSTHLIVVKGSMNTQILGINNHDSIVGSYVDADGNTHGFIKAEHHAAVSVDDPNAVGTTVLNGLNDNGRIVGFYVDADGNTDGLLAFQN